MKKIIIKGKLPTPRSPAARDMAENPPSGSGVHGSRPHDVKKGRRRKDKHPKRNTNEW